MKHKNDCIKTSLTGKARRIVPALLAFCLLLAMTPILAPEAEAAWSSTDGILERIEALKLQFPDGCYWNHLVVNGLDGDTLLANRDGRYGDSVTNTPCATHSGRASNQQYDCNFYGGGLQCWGFACKIFYEIFGQDCAALPRRYDKENIAVGDYVRFGSDQNGHSFVVTGKEGGVVTVVECNFGASASDRCKIKWGRKIDLNASPYGLSFGYYIHADNYEEVKNSRSVHPESLRFGQDFYAYILSKLGEGSGTLLLSNTSTADSQNVATARWDGNAYNTRNIWHFVWDGSTASYKITSVYDGRCLDVCNADDCAGGNIWVYQDNDTAAQRWRLVRASGSYFAMLPDCTRQGLVADVTGGSTAPGANLEMWTPNGSAAQLFAISKLTVSYAKPAKPAQPTLVQTYPGNMTSTISWQQVASSSRFDKRAYEVVVDGISYTTTDSYIVLPLGEGAHSVKIRAVNTLYQDWASEYTTAAFSVVKQYVDFSKEVITGCIPEPA